MTDDEFSKSSGVFLEQAATAGAVAAATTLADPGVGILVGAAFASAFDWFKRRAEQHAPAFAAFDPAVIAELGENFKRLDAELNAVRERLRVAEQRLDMHDPLSQEAVFTELALALAKARTPQKRQVLVRAAARQFDPTTGEPSVRQYWMDRVASLRDIQLRVLVLLGAHLRIVFHRGLILVVENAGGAQVGRAIRGFAPYDAVALEVAAREMSADSKDPSSLVLIKRAELLLDVGEQPEKYTTVTFELTDVGQGLAEFIRA